MKSNCRSIQVASERAGDEHYRVFTASVVSRLRGVMLTNCMAGALAYKTTLEELLACLQKRQLSPSIEKQIADTLVYLLVIDKDILVLRSREKL